MKDILAIVGVLVLVFGIIAIFSLIGAGILMLAWNFVVLGLFHGPALGFWQAYAISIMLSIIGSAFKTTVTKS